MTSGFLLVDKPAGMTSHDVVARLRRALGTRKVGHAGTLDPMATGLLIVGVDAGTRLLRYCVGLPKTYEATIRLGASTTTDDAEGEVTAQASPTALARVDDTALARGIAVLTGAIMQVPSAVSALRVDGVRAYQRVRAGEDVVLPARPVTVSAWDMLASRRADTHWDCDVRVSCSSGTYIRALARDLGASLGVGGHLTALRRTWVGDFAVTEPTVVRDPVTATHEVSLSLAAAACRVLLSIPVTEAEATQLRHGRTLPLPEDLAADALAADGLWAAVRGDTLIAIVTARDGRLRVATGFPGEGS